MTKAAAKAAEGCTAADARGSTDDASPQSAKRAEEPEHEGTAHEYRIHPQGGGSRAAGGGSQPVAGGAGAAVRPGRPAGQRRSCARALEELGESYAGRGVELLETAQGFRVQVRREVSEKVSRLWPERPPRYSRALLETLSIIAYRQPLTRAEIETIRGVAVNPEHHQDAVRAQLDPRGGHREVPGRPELLGTTREFPRLLRTQALDQLPPLAELKSLEELDPQLLLPETHRRARAGSDGDHRGRHAGRDS